MKLKRKLDSANRIVIPQELLDKLHVEPFAHLEIDISGSKIIITNPLKRCELCGAERNLLDDTNICVKCAANISESLEKKLKGEKKA